MFSKAVTYDLLKDLADCKAVDERQQWVLTAMRKHGPELVTMLWRILGHEQDVCDAYQTTFLHLAHRDGGEKPRHLKAYLFRTASNAAITMLRQHVIDDRKLGDMERAARGSPAAEGDLDSRHLAETLRRCVAQLPEHLRGRDASRSGRAVLRGGSPHPGHLRRHREGVSMQGHPVVGNVDGE